MGEEEKKKEAEDKKNRQWRENCNELKDFERKLTEKELVGDWEKQLTLKEELTRNEKEHQDLYQDIEDNQTQLYRKGEENDKRYEREKREDLKRTLGDQLRMK